MRAAMTTAVAMILFLGLATLAGFLISYDAVEATADETRPERDSVEAMVRMMIGLVLFIAVGGSILGNTVCLLLTRRGSSS